MDIWNVPPEEVVEAGTMRAFNKHLDRFAYIKVKRDKCREMERAQEGMNELG